MPDGAQQERIKNATNNLIEMFTSGNMPDAISMTVIKKQADSGKPSQYWSIGNQLIMLASKTEDARGFRQWQAVGRFVQKGAKAIYIFSPITKVIKAIPGADDQNDRVVLLGFIPIPVFRLEDTRGKEIVYPDYSPPQLPPFSSVAEKLGLKVEYKPAQGNYYGRYAPARGLITLCSHEPVVFFHELAHAVHNTFKDILHADKAETETTAELAAAVLCHLQGVSGYEKQAFRYIEYFTGKTPGQDTLKLIMKTLNDVETIVSKILDLDEASLEEASLVS